MSRRSNQEASELETEVTSEWKEKGYELPSFDVEAVRKKHRENPTWVHFGAKNIFRAFRLLIAESNWIPASMTAERGSCGRL